MDYEIKPLKGVGAIEFGMSPLEVRSRIGKEFKSFKRTPADVFPGDYFPSIGMFAYYKASAELEALEFASPAQPIFEGMRFLNMNFDDAAALLQTKDAALEKEVDGVISHAIGISLYAPLAKENPSSPCESVLVFAAGYYD